ncbi:MAG: glycosyltransferase family 2 protein [Gammaproteobacteria bacterium]|nr:MAG: glycosyltransferase family 2 protein [Gammaproteobacteria bacterium]
MNPPRRAPVSAVIITLNAERLLDKCLRSVAFCDEILVVDSGSTDRTLEIAREHGARIIHQDWLGFGPQKRFAVEQAAHDWVLCLDADEWVSEELQASIEGFLVEPAAQAAMFPRCNRFLGRWLRHGEGYPDWSLRLFDRRHGNWSDDAVHERVIARGNIVRLQGDLMHESQETLHEYLEKQNRYTTLQARALAEAGKRASVSRLLFSPAFRFLRLYLFRLGFMDGVPGLVHVTIGSMNTAIKYMKLMELNHASDEHRPAR